MDGNDQDQEQTHLPPFKKPNQKLRVKLKINKIRHQEPEQEEEELGIGQQIGRQKNDEPRVCHVCRKGFSSGKALGGHMRVHVQANNKEEQMEEHNDDTAHDRNRAICSLCFKHFPSMKSLFGHMRCHPEREWRGIQPPRPPPPAPASLSPASSVSDQIDLVESLRGWSSTAKRGRRALIADDPPVEEDRLHEAVRYLIKLAHGEPFHSGLSPTHEKRVDENGNLTEIGVLESKKRGIEDSLGGYNVGYDHPVKKLKIEEEGKGKAVVLGDIRDCEEFVQDDETESNYSDCSIPSGSLIVNYKGNGQRKSYKKRKKLKLRDLGSPGVDKPSPLVYKCSTCDKCFSTHQALGGHRSSHNKFKNFHQEDNDNTHVSNHPPANGVDELKEDEEDGGGGLKVVAHQCKICNKNFPSGQALGGHKRCHWAGPLEGPPSRIWSPGEASHTGQKILGFDLNEVPAMEDEVEDESEHHHVGAGYGHASNSSYNSRYSVA